LDRDQCVLFKPRPGETVRPLPELTGLRNRDLEAGQKLDRPEILAVVSLLKEMELTPLRTALDIRSIDVGQPTCLKVTTAQGAVIYFRLTHMAAQLHRLTEILNIAMQRGQQIASVDLTLDRNVPVIFAQASEVGI
jgi:cell division septal protein FtsQ